MMTLSSNENETTTARTRVSILGVIAVLVLVCATTIGSASAIDATRDSSGASEAGASEGTTVAKLKARGFVCEKSDDSGKRGAIGCFKDEGDEWYACDIHGGGSGTAYVVAGKSQNSYQTGFERKTEEDNARDGTSVPGDCDEGPEMDIPNDFYMHLMVCIAKRGSVVGGTCDERWIEE